MRYLYATLFSLALSSTVFAACCCYYPEVDFVGQGGNYRRGGGVYGWVPVRQDPYRVFFLQGGGGYFRRQGVGTIGAGYRKRISSRLAYGVNGFADACFTQNGHAFGQLGAGVELLTCRALFRLNGYGPFGGRRTFFSEPGATLNGTAIIGLDNTRFEFPLPGFDLELGGEIDALFGEVWGYAGYFYHKRGSIRAVQGPRLRLEYRLDIPKLRSQLVLGGWWEQDRLHGSTASATLEVRMPFCRLKGPKASLCNLMGRRVIRDLAIWVDDFAASNETGQIGTLIFANNTIDGIGTQTNPATIDNAFAMAGTGDCIFLLQDTGDMSPAATILLDSSQKVLGFGDSSFFDLQTANGAILRINDLTNAGRGIVNGSVPVTAFEAASNTLFQGIGVDDGLVGIVMMSGTSGVEVQDVVFNSQTGASIFNDGGANLLVENVRITGALEGVRATDATGTLIIRNSDITASDPVIFSTTNLDFGLVTGSTLRPVTNGVRLDSVEGLYVITDSTIFGGTTGVNIMDTPAIAQVKDIRVLKTQILGPGLRGIRVVSSEASSVYVFNDNIITGPVDEGIQVDIDIGTHNVEICRNEVESLTEDAILVDADARTTLLIQGNFGIAADQFIDVDFGGGSTADGNVTIVSNNSLNAPGTLVGYRVDRSSGSAPVCVTMIGNNRVVTPFGILLDSNANPMEVFDLPNISANNNNLDVTTLPVVVNTTTRCPLPVIPPLPFTL